VRDEDVLVDADAAAAPALVEHLRRYVLRDDVKLAVEEGTTAVTVLGARAADALARLDVRGFADPRRGAPAWCVPVEVAREGELRRALVAAGAVELSADEAEALRIAAGVPRWGAEIDGSRLVMEAALTGSAVSFEKGCYLGQEVVLRGTFRGQVQRGLVQVRLPEDAGPGAVLRAGEQEVGRVTSAANAPGGRLGLAYLRRAHWAPGTRLATDGGEAEVARPLVSEKD
jgi:folate-binding protein YgfZ